MFVISPKCTSCSDTEREYYHGLLSLLGHSVAAVNCYSLGNRKHDLSMEAVAKFSFTASQVDELSFEKGSVLNVLDKDEDKNWYKAEQGDREGWIPNTYITMKPHKWFHGKITRNQAEDALSQVRCDGAFLIRESESSPGDFSLSVRTGDHVQHFKIFKNAERRYYLWSETFSSLNLLVEHHRSSSVSKTQHIVLNEVDFRDEMVQAVFSFTAQDHDELSFNAGDWITVLDKSNENWWKGQVHNAVGFFPSNYVSMKTINKT